MKLKYIIGSAIISISTFTGCSDPEYATPDTTVTPTNLSANFLLANVATDAPSLNLIVNNEIAGGAASPASAQTGYNNVPIGSNGGISNVNVRARGATTDIGGLLGSKDLIFRSSNNGVNNFTAADSAYYTFIALDSITRPAPLRTSNALGIGDTTYFNPLTGKYIAGIERAPLPAAQKSRTVAVGTVPLGSSDPGGVRFLVITDQLPLPSTTRFPKPSATQAAVRFIHASPNTGAVTASIGGFNFTTTGATAQGFFSYPMAFASFNPSVGSRSTTANVYATIAAGAPANIVVRSGATELARLDNFTFQGSGVYTIILSGNRRLTPMPLTIIKNK